MNIRSSKHVEICLGEFKDNIFFISLAGAPKLSTIVERLFEHNGYKKPEFQSDEDLVHQLENLLKQIGKNPMLLVLDGVLPESASLVQKFVFQIRKYKILVTSRFTIKGFGEPYIAKGCCGSPLALIVTGKSLSLEAPVVWHNRAKTLSEGHSILAYNQDELFTCLQKSFDDLDAKVAESFRDLSLFPEAQKIPAAALVDIWAEQRDEDDDTAMENIHKLVQRNVADMVVTRSTASGPDEEFTSEWCNLQPNEVEVLVMNLREKKHSLPMFMKKMNKLKVLIITNYDVNRAELENLELLDYLSDLKRIRLEKVSIPFLSKTGVPLKNLHKFSFFMCNVNEAFKNSTIKVCDVLPNLKEMNIDYCDMEELRDGLSDIVSLKKLSITNCHKLSKLPKGIGKLVNLESLRLTSCTELEELPDSITSLRKLKFLDISDCVSLGNLPENIGKLRSLERFNCRGCTRLYELPYSVNKLESLSVVVCDEEKAALWEPLRPLFSNLKLDVDRNDFIVDSLL
ncbi:hypothetical protein VNO80_21030 [Phaseolus coccineus]|uniref:Disease resistance R13L4/SHOC-2-like LRR domain-containing protein n=1 Tax=Phaseolus coccineus TaxID=3886 RepID=A0AAN9M5D8_PHACN